ncbi:Predicted branched-chain amino acid permease (azaleucine resistance) [Devosia lucknowensis]|uniref:Predicted branched-chain amino acid permease (Azaleucine resistance) n=1 Tax=Devosia lucknowensis TaxID=1096929 RepID=A0A1Y6F5K7_9HYPH|nr:AzlC family ABC transporter permease [Devosia lucknowensis]SMQ70238.1 Predicted branched-chain amino acid permease (azaleucine resistance) [Devosia lucknowensis]
MSNDVLDGLKAGAVIALSTSPFAVLFGAVAVDNGLTIVDAGLMSATIYAGASQLVGIELFGNHVAPWLIVLSVFAVNFRHILYSAAIARYIRGYSPVQKALAFFFLIDPQFAEAIRRGESGKSLSFSWYMAFALVIYFPWILFSVLGAWFGSMLGDPRVWAIDVLLPIYFLGLVVGFRRKPGFYPVVATSMLCSVAAYYLVGSPWHVSIGAICGVLVAALLPLPPRPAAVEEASH